MSPLSIVVILLLAVSTVYGTIANECLPTAGGNATSVLGQALFSTALSGNTTSQFNGPNAVIVDSTFGKVYATDQNNSRVLRYNSTAALLTNSAAELILFGGNGSGCANNTLLNPEQMDYLNTDVYVADFSNNRVVKLTGAYSTNITIPAVTVTFGQPNASFCTSAGTLKDMIQPTGVTINSNGTMYVSETGAANCWIKRFDLANNASNYPAPNSLIGNGTCNVVSQVTISNNPGYLHVDDVNGHLWAADDSWNRVLLFKQAQLKANATGTADTVYGQGNFSTSVAACSATGLSGPYGVYYNYDDDVLHISDFNNSRVALFDSPTTIASGSNITFVVGQANSSVCAAGSTTQTSFNGPTGLFYEPDFPGYFLLVSDFNNNRIMRFQCTNNTFSLTETLSGTIAASVNASSVNPSTLAASVNGSSVVANASSVNASVAGSSVVASVNASTLPASVAASSVAPSIINTTTGSTSASQSNTPSQTGTASSSRTASRTGTNSKTATSLCGNGVKEPTEQCEGGACCSHRCRFYKANRPCGFRPAGTTKVCVRKRRCNGLGVCRPAVIKQNPLRKCKKTDGSKGLCDITTGACV